MWFALSSHARTPLETCAPRHDRRVPRPMPRQTSRTHKPRAHTLWSAIKPESMSPYSEIPTALSPTVVEFGVILHISIIYHLRLVVYRIVSSFSFICHVPVTLLCHIYIPARASTCTRELYHIYLFKTCSKNNLFCSLFCVQLILRNIR